jgi:TRAP-type C4-dicarboxylate transport system permease small subunit
MQKLQRLNSFLHSCEDGLLFLLVIAMLGLSVLQIFLRDFFDFGIVWSETLTRLLVLWTAMIGSMIASRASQHIRIDLVERFYLGKFRNHVLGAMQLFTALICLAMAYYSTGFLMLEYEDGTTAFADLPSWLFISIIPFAFLIMGVRYLTNAIFYAAGKSIPE